MGLGIAIAGSISVTVAFFAIIVIVGNGEEVIEISDAKTDINKAQNIFGKTLLQISSLTAEAGNDLFTFYLTNGGSERIWNYEDFSFIITYDADVGGTTTRLSEVFTFSEPDSFYGDSDPDVARPIADNRTGGWTATPLYQKIDESTRSDADYISSPGSTGTPTNDVEVELSGITDPESGYGHLLRYTYQAPPLDDNKGILGYGELAALFPKYREYDGSSFGSEADSSAPIINNIQWAVVKASPATTEKVMATISVTTNLLTVQTWNGAVWTTNWTTNLAASDTRVFDIAYEDQSNDVIVVFGDGSNQLKFRKRVSGIWDASNGNAGTVFAVGELPKWVVAKSKPDSNEIFVGILTDDTLLHAMRWNSSNAWDNQTTTATAPHDRDYQCFDIAFERASGDAFLIWGDNNKQLYYQEFTTSWNTEAIAYTLLNDDVRWVSAGYNPESDSSEIAVGMLQRDNELEFGAWDGSVWETRPASIAGVSDNRGISVDFEKSTGDALFSFATDANKQQLSWRTWSDASGFSSVTTETGSTNDIRFLQLRADPLSNRMMALYSDSNSDLFHRVWNGSSWSALGTALENSLSSSNDREPFMFAWHEVPITTLTVQLRQGETVIASWNEENVIGTEPFVQKTRTLSTTQADSITNYTDLRVRYVVTGNQIDWSWAEFVITLFTGDANEWGIRGIGDDGLDPRILNPGESAEVIGRLPYPPVTGGFFQATVISDSGKVTSDSITV